MKFRRFPKKCGNLKDHFSCCKQTDNFLKTRFGIIRNYWIIFKILTLPCLVQSCTKQPCKKSENFPSFPLLLRKTKKNTPSLIDTDDRKTQEIWLRAKWFYWLHESLKAINYFKLSFTWAFNEANSSNRRLYHIDEMKFSFVAARTKDCIYLDVLCASLCPGFDKKAHETINIKFITQSISTVNSTKNCFRVRATERLAHHFHVRCRFFCLKL